MHSEFVTTPFGRRPMSLGMLENQQRAETVDQGTVRNKWKLFRAICEARPILGISDRALTVLDALLSFYPSNEISREHGLIVFPSNAQLSIRARGMTPATLRRHLAALVDAGLIIRKDSPNGKRYARRDRAGALNQAFGFSLAPLLARAKEIEDLAAQALSERELLRTTKERLSLYRRDVTKLIETAVQTGISGDWETVFHRFRSSIDEVPRAATIDTLLAVIDQLCRLRDEIVNRLKIQLKVEKVSANESHNERHIQDSYPETIYELEAPRDEDHQPIEVPMSSDSVLTASVPSVAEVLKTVTNNRQMKSVPLELVLRACPEILPYGPGGTIKSWRDLMTAAVTVRTMLGVTPSAYQHACVVMGPENAAIVVACILERSNHITSAGGYLRDLARRSEKGAFSVGPMLMALMRTGAQQTNVGPERHCQV
ncbi:replication initiation protein RepC [Agrobacterium fabrum]|uniref:plasmid replication protein RepC n=1 Tax=Agrobacterium fabrum TaxID=1176649 RepID=UPI000EF5FF67|nr:plasmid replication protein RepC [Agrobacterium fabrum]AYM65994.1 replication protein C [Agrobacterium fabrum]NTE63440.1 replication initiation protein RepC [Agrobacterium fabrum]